MTPQEWLEKAKAMFWPEITVGGEVVERLDVNIPGYWLEAISFWMDAAEEWNSIFEDETAFSIRDYASRPGFCMLTSSETNEVQV